MNNSKQNTFTADNFLKYFEQYSELDFYLLNKLNQAKFAVFVLDQKLNFHFGNHAFNQILRKLNIPDFTNFQETFKCEELAKIQSKSSHQKTPFTLRTIHETPLGNFQKLHLTFTENKKQFSIFYQSDDSKKIVFQADQFQLLHEQLSVGVGFYDIEGRILSYNKVAAAHLNKSPEFFKGKKLEDIFSADQAKLFNKRMEECLKSDQVLEYIDEIPLTQGSVWFKSTYSKVYCVDKTPLGIQIVSNDITALKTAQHHLIVEQKKYKSLVDHLNSGLALHEIITDENGKPIDFTFLHINHAYEKLTKLKAKDIIGKRGTRVIPKLEQKWIDLYGEIALSGKPKHIIDYSEYLNKYWDIMAFSPAKNQFAVILNDITELKRKEIIVDRFFQQSNVIHLVAQLDGTIIKVNNGWKEILDYNETELVGQKFFSLIHPEDIEKTEDEMKKLSQGITTFSFINRYRHKNGQYISLAWSANVDLNESLVFATARDINEQQIAMSELRDSEEKFRTFLNNASDGVAIVDESGDITFVNEAFCKLLNLTQQEILSFKAWDMIYNMSGNTEKRQSDIKEIKSSVIQLLQSTEDKEVAKNKTKIKRKNSDQLIDVVESVFTFTTNQGKRIGVFLRDISDLTQAEKELQSAYELLSETEKISKSGSWTFNPKTGEGTWSRGSYQIRKAPFNIKGSLMNHEKFMHPDDIETYRKVFNENSESDGTEFKQFYRLIDIDGNIRYIEAHYEIQRDKNGKPIFVTGIDKDVSDRVETEKALRKSQERFQLAMRASQDGLFDWDLVSNEIYYSPGWKRMLGYEEDELPNDFSVWEQLTHPTDVEESWKRLEAHIKGETNRFEMEFRMKHKDGHYVDILSRANAIFNNEGKAIRMVGTHVDISESTKILKKLDYQKKLTQQYLNVAGIMLMVLNTNQEVIMINPKGCEILGYSESEIIGKNWFDHFIPKKDIDQIKEVFNAAIHNEIDIVEYFENPILTKNGEERIIAWHNSSIKDENGIIISLFSSGNDITEEIKSKKALEKSEEKFRDLFEKSGDAVFILEEETIINCNEASINLFGFSNKKELIGKTPKDLSPIYQFNKEKSSEKVPLYIELARIEHTYRFEWKHQKSDGSIFPCEVLLTYIGKNENNKNTTHAVMRNISLRKQREAEVIQAKEKAEESQLKLEEAQRIAKLGSWEFDVKTGLFTLTDNYFRIFHTSAEKIGGYQVDLENFEKLFVHPEDTHLVQNENRRALDPNNTIDTNSLEHRINYFDGGIGHLSVRYYLVKDETDNTTKIYGIIQDITEKKNAEQEIIKAKEKAEESDRLKSAFLANMSHEIRTPMNGILGFADLLKEPQLEAGEMKQYIEVIERSGKRMLNIINDLIDISKIEAEQMEVVHKETNINQQIQYLYTFFNPEAKRKNIILKTHTPLSSQKSIIISDREKIYAILTNLIKNALKYSESGKIEFGYKDNGDQLMFFVSDEGIGIPKAKQNNIFDRFVQAELDHNRKFEGAGLGLAISKAYVEMLGGKIWIDQNHLQGTKFCFTIPIKT